LEAAWRVVSSPGAAGQGAIAQARHHVRERHRARRRRRAAITSLSLAAALVMLALLPSRWPGSDADQAPVRIVQRPDLRTLPDGSTVQLNAGTEIVPAFASGRRLVRILRGEALFNVVHDSARPFVVAAGGVEVRAVGTAFSVRFDPAQVDVLVTEGTVSVAAIASALEEPAAEAPPGDPLLLAAGQRSVVPLAVGAAPTIARVTPTEVAAALAWRDRRIEFTRTPLADAVELFNRQNELQLAVADDATGAFEISGIFWANDPESFVRLLESAFDMTIDRSSRRVIVGRR
jgi:transmembrane sensor